MLKYKTTRFLAFFTLFWSTLTLVFDVFCARSLAGQWLSNRFVPVEATILSSEIKVHQDSDGTTYGAAIRYEYRVAGRHYESDRVRYGQMSESGGHWARQTVAENPAGATRPIWYNPADPAEAVLQRGISGQELFLALFLTPFNAVMIALWSGFVAGWRPVPPAGGARILTGRDEINVWLPRLSPAYSALAAAGGMAFILIFVLGFTGGFSPPLGYLQLAWGAVLLAGVAGFYGGRRWQRQAAPDLVISASAGTLSLATAKPTLLIPLERVRDVVVRERITATSDGQSLSLVVALLTAQPAATETTEHDLGTWLLPARAEAFAAWLRETLGLRP